MVGLGTRGHVNPSVFSKSQPAAAAAAAAHMLQPPQAYLSACYVIHIDDIELTGYDYVPTVRGGPSFKIYQKGVYSGRIVEYSDTKDGKDWVKMVELWSLNSDGPFDDTEHPQEFNADEPWLPFIELYGRGVVEWANVLSMLILERDDICTIDDTLVEDLLRRNFGLDLALWRIKEKLRQRGAPYSNLPTFPSSDIIRHLSGSGSYLPVLKHIVAIQRGL
ncbi:uncharacterized protein EV420DRAFT_1487294 [Desarmillaria tabescens]|uniref:Uncharacterized protein n=1 Tax=Armillaria tabescens TaxID=1929756 RepID=A0AA39MKA2_ARMTA|nr:uncharacterized protein EV420DRAFT_1487294 [Desarmillaria tabescens]KAK0436968.1 hypothetical protein EV420DRAFT_1487294 [Desarmillaria tabescens]